MSEELTVAIVASVVTLLSTLGGVGISGIIAASRQKKAFENERERDRSLREHESDRKRRELRLEKLEVIATTANETITALERLFGHLLKSALVSPDKSGNETIRMAMSELRSLEMELTALPVSYLNMLVDFYARELYDQVASVTAAEGALSRSLQGVLDKASTSERRERLRYFEEHLLAMEEACRQLRRAAADLVQKELRFESSKE